MATYLVDGHVHFHECFDARSFLDGAAANFQRNANGLAHGQRWLGCLLLADMAGQQSLCRLLQASGASQMNGWNLSPAEESFSAIAVRDDGCTLIIVGGQQVVSAEKMEVLVLASDLRVPDALSVRDTLETVRGKAVIPVLPWGFGKWWFRRGTEIRMLLESVCGDPPEGRCELFLGDNGGRPRFSRQPRLFGLAENLGVRILPGTDPLPLVSHASRAGQFGFILRGPLNLQHPAREIRRMLYADSCQPVIFGRRTGWTQFVWHQTAIRLAKAVR